MVWVNIKVDFQEKLDFYMYLICVMSTVIFTFTLSLAFAMVKMNKPRMTRKDLGLLVFIQNKKHMQTIFDDS